MLRTEIKKIVRNRSFIIFLLLLALSLAISFFSLFYSNGMQETKYDLIKVYKEASKIKEDDAVAWAEQEYNKQVSNIEQTNKINSLAFAYKTYKEHLLEISKYSEYINSVINTADDMIVATRESKSFIERNAVRTKCFYQNLADIKLQPECNVPVEFLTNNKILDFSLLIFVILLSVYSVKIEEQNNVKQIIIITKKGRKGIIPTKIAAIYIVIIWTTVSICILTLALYVFRFGIVTLDAPIQSVYGYISCPYKLTIAGYILLNCLLKLISYYLISSLAVLLSVCIQGIMLPVIFTSVFLGINQIIYTNVMFFSSMYIFKEINLAALYNSKDCFTSMHNINIFSYAVDSIFLRCIISVFIAALNIAAASKCFLFCKGLIKNPKSQTLSKEKTLFALECKKMFVGNNNWVILPLFILICMIILAFRNYRIDIDEYYYQRYVDLLEDMSYEEQKIFVSTERKTLDGVEKEKNSAKNAFNNRTITYEVYLYRINQLDKENEREAALVRIEMQLSNIEQLRLSDDKEYRIVGTTAWSKILGIGDYTYYLIMYIIISIILSVSVSEFELVEKRTGMSVLLCATLYGNTLIYKNKKLTEFVYSAALIGIFNTMNIILVILSYGRIDSNIYFAEILLKKSLFGKMPVWSVFVIVYITETAMAALLCFINGKIAKKYGNELSAITAELALFTLPAFMILIAVNY